jgi:TetR/AcrR family transcriptional repressor of nem operon
MNRKQSQRQQTHDHIIDAARKMFRAEGYQPTGIGQVMSSIGLTVGGFYNHFESKDALLAEVVRSTVSKAVESGETDLTDPQYTHNLARRYLSRAHRDDPAGGCLLPALSAEVARADDAVRTQYTQFLTRLIDKMTSRMSDREGRSAGERAWAVTALSVGGLLLSRAVNDEQLSDYILATCRKAAEEV